MNRRSFIRGAGALSILFAGGTAWRAWDQGVIGGPPAAAYVPWDTWRTGPDDGPFGLVRAGILAASPHNTQPWRFRIGDATIDVLADSSRHLSSMDPYRREMHIGLGCVVENMVQAAPAYGLRARVTLVPGRLVGGDGPDTDQLVARLRLAPGPRRASPLFEAIPSRHTDRGPYDNDRPLPADTEAVLSRLAGRRKDPAFTLLGPGTERDRLGELIIEATERIGSDAEMIQDSHRWYRHQYDAIERYRDGVTLETAGLSPMLTTVARMLPRPSAAANHGYWLDSTRNVQVPTATAFGLISVTDPHESAQALHVGRVWQRMHLWATTRGLAVQPINQAPEVADRERQFGDEAHMARKLRGFGTGAGLEPTFVFRLGFPTRPASASPRRDLDAVTA